MTQEEKARAYDEALKQAKFYHGNCPSEPERKKLEKMFPVLHENEDERIRRELIEFIQWSEDRGMTRHDFHQAKRPSEWIAYLEKQKEQKEFPLMNGDADLYFDTWRQEVPVPTFRQCFEEGMRYAQRLQKEQKPGEDNEYRKAYWKPSEEQMKWLKDVIETVPMTCRQQIPLESLYNDLLKLM